MRYSILPQPRFFSDRPFNGRSCDDRSFGDRSSRTCPPRVRSFDSRSFGDPSPRARSFALRPFFAYLTLLLLASASLVSLHVSAQDLDFPDFRSKKDNFSRVRENAVRSDLASFTLAGVDESIGKAVLKNLPVREYGNNFMIFDGENITVTIRTGVFDPAKNKVMRQEDHILKINGHPYYGGIYGQLPKTTIKSITVTIGKDSVAIPPEAYADLFEPRFTYTQSGAERSRNNVYLSADKTRIYIYMLNAENGGTEYTWVIQDKGYLRRVVDYGFIR